MDDFLPSAFTPFARRFTDEKARDLRDTRELYARGSLFWSLCATIASSLFLPTHCNIPCAVIISQLSQIVTH